MGPTWAVSQLSFPISRTSPSWCRIGHAARDADAETASAAAAATAGPPRRRRRRHRCRVGAGCVRLVAEEETGHHRPLRPAAQHTRDPGALRTRTTSAASPRRRSRRCRPRRLACGGSGAAQFLVSAGQQLIDSVTGQQLQKTLTKRCSLSACHIEGNSSPSLQGFQLRHRS